jgi:hypothetical protein
MLEHSGPDGYLIAPVGLPSTVERQSEKSPGGPLRVGALALLIFGFLVLVTLAASGGRPTLHGHLAARPVPNTLQDSWVTLLTITYAVVIVGVLLTLLHLRNRFQDPGSPWLRNYCIILVFMALFTGIGYLVIIHGHFRERLQKQQAQQGQTRTRRPLPLKPLPARQAHFQWPVVFGLGALVLLGGVWVVIRRDRRPESATPEGSVEEERASNRQHHRRFPERARCPSSGHSGLRDTGRRASALALAPRCGPRSLRAGGHPGGGLERGFATRGCHGGGGVISPAGKNRAPVASGLAALALLGAIGVYSAIAGDRLVSAVAALGGVGLCVTALALVGRWATLLPVGVVGVGAAYTLFLGLRPDTVDGHAPVVAAAFFTAAELSFWSIERRSWRTEGSVVVRRLALLVSTGLATAIVGGLLLLITSERRSGSDRRLRV